MQNRMLGFPVPRPTTLVALFCALIPVAPAQTPAPPTPPPPGQPRLVVQLGHTASIQAVAFSPDGRWVLTGSDDHTAKLWDARIGLQIRTFEGHTAGITGVAFSPDSRRIVTGSWDYTERIWDVESGRVLQTMNQDSASPTYFVAFSPDGRKVLTGDYLVATLWDAGSGQRLRDFTEGHAVFARSGVFSPDGRAVLVGYAGGAAELFDAETGKLIRTFKGHSKELTTVAFTPDGRGMLTGSRDSTVKLWDVASGDVIRTFTTSQKPSLGVPVCFALSPDGRSLLTSIEKGPAQIWDVDSGRALRTIPASGVSGVLYSPNGREVLTVSAFEKVKLWDSENGREMREFEGRADPVGWVAVSPDGRSLLTRSHGAGTNLWDLVSGKQSRTFPGRAWYTAFLALSPDGLKLLTNVDDNSPVRILDAVSGRELRPLIGHTPPVMSAAFSPDGSRVVTGSLDATAKLWDAESGRELRTFDGHQGYVTSVAFSPDARAVLTGGFDGTAKLWDVNSDQEVRTIAHFSPSLGYHRSIDVVAFAPNGLTFITGSYDGLKLWDRETGQEVRAFPTVAGILLSATFSPDGRWLLTGGSDGAHLWETASGREIVTYSGHQGSVNHVTLSPDGRKVFTAGQDGTTRIWDKETGRELCSLVSFIDGSWAVVDKEGRYDASNQGDVEGLHWVIGDTPIKLSQLKQRFYDPGLLAKYMGFNKEPLLEVAKLEAPKLFPAVTVDPPSPGSTSLHIHLANQGGGIGKVRVLVNGKEIAADARGPKPKPDAAKADLSINLAGATIAPGQINKIEVVAWNAEGYLSSRGTVVDWTAPGPADSAKPELYAIVAGVSQYADSAFNLNFPGRDAESFAHALALGANRLFGPDRFHITILTTNSKPGLLPPTRDNLHQAFAAAQKARPDDVLVVYLAGHGVALKDLYAYPTAEARTLDLSDPAIRAQTAITSEEFVEWIKKIPARHQVMILDTCAAGAAAVKLAEKRDIPGDEIRALDQLKDRTGFYVLMGSAADAVSYEASKYGQGLLTYALLTGMKGAALQNDVDVDVSKLFQFAVDDVPTLAKGIGGVQRPQIIAPTVSASFAVGQLRPTDREQIQLAVEKPIFLRPQLVNAEGPDDLELAAALRRELRNETYGSTRSSTPVPDAIFVDADDMPGAIRVSGTYTVDESKVTVHLWLARNKSKTKVEAEGQSNDVPALAAKLTAAILAAGKHL